MGKLQLLFAHYEHKSKNVLVIGMELFHLADLFYQ